MEMKKFGTIAMLILLLATGCTQTASKQGSTGGENKRRLESHKTTSEDCYSLGYRYARYITLGRLGIQDSPEDNIVIPVECREAKSTLKGMKAGVEAVYKKYNIPLEGIK